MTFYSEIMVLTIAHRRRSALRISAKNSSTPRVYRRHVPSTRKTRDFHVVDARYQLGVTENAGVENAIRAKLQGWKMQEWKMQEWKKQE